MTKPIQAGVEHPLSGSVASRIAAWAALAAGADLASKTGAAWLTGRGVLRGRIVHSVNPAFSLGVARPAFAVMILLAVLLIVGFGGWTVRLAIGGRVPAWAPGLLIGGAGANLLDRLAFGAVHDWLRISGVTMNLADVLVLAGVLGVGGHLASDSGGRR